MLKVENLKRYYKTNDVEVRALDGVSFDVEKGEFISIIGASGSGKSTLLHLLGGLDYPTSGKVFIDGTDIYAWKMMREPFLGEEILVLSFKHIIFCQC